MLYAIRALVVFAYVAMKFLESMVVEIWDIYRLRGAKGLTLYDEQGLRTMR